MTTAVHIEMIDATVRETYDWLDQIGRELERHTRRAIDRHEALQALRAALHVLRDELTVDQNAHLCAQLPTLVRGVYFEGWDPPNEPVRHHETDEVLDDVARAFSGYSTQLDPEIVARAVLAVLEGRVSGECRKIKPTLSKGLRAFWGEA